MGTVACFRGKVNPSLASVVVLCAVFVVAVLAPVTAVAVLVVLLLLMLLVTTVGASESLLSH